MRACKVVALAALSGGPLAVRAQQAPRVEVTLAPDTVTIGQPFVVTVHVQAPAGATVTFPMGPDSSAGVQNLDPRHLAPMAGSGVDHSATYRMAAWDVGALSLAMPDVVVRVNGSEKRLSLAGASVQVRSVLPADSALRVPKPPRDIFTTGAFPWWILAVLAAMALAWWLVRRRSRGRQVPLPTGPSAFEIAEHRFARVEALGLVEAGESGQHVSLMVQVLREYLAARYPLAGLSFTSRELVRQLADARALPHARLATLLEEADLIKFARQRPAAARALALAREARDLVASDDAATRVGSAPDREAA